MRRWFGIPLIILLLLGGGAALAIYVFPDLKNLFLLGRDMSKEFGKPVSIADNTTNGRRELVLTMNTRPSQDPTANEGMARRVANFARMRLPNGDSFTSIEVVLQEQVMNGAIRINKEPVRFKWTPAQLREAPPALKSNVAANVSTPTVTPAGTPTHPPSRAAPPPKRTPATLTAFARLAAADRAVRWVVDSAIVADIDCDHLADTVVVGRRRAEIHVGFARGASAAPQILIFDVGRGVKGAVCGTGAQLRLESLDFDPAERGLASLDGFRRSTTCKGVGLGDGDCRTAHIFWSEKTQHLEWYQ
jgi:hypothetical protein